MNITTLSMKEIIDKVKKQEISVENLLSQYIKNIENYSRYNAVVEVFTSSIEKAKEIDNKIKQGIKVGKLAGVTIIISDNLLYKNHKMSCSSNILKSFVSPYTATVIQKIIDEDAIILGRANMDEFGLGLTTKTSIFGICKNAIKENYHPGNGNSVAVALNLCSASISIDSTGAVRQSASLNGLVGLKPTYGKVSRFGVTGYASSFSQVGTITKTVEDSMILFNIMSGYDENDQTSHKIQPVNYLTKNISDLKVGIIPQANKLLSNEENQNLNSVLNLLKTNKIKISEINMPLFDCILPASYIVTSAETASNLARFDGIKYSARSKKTGTVEEVYTNSRNEGFNKEIKIKTILGNYFLSSSNYKDYYKKARNIIAKFTMELDSIFEKYDIVLLPTTLNQLIENSSAKKELYQDIFTAPSSVTGTPSIVIPHIKNAPFSVQLIAKSFNEQTLFNLGAFIESEFSKEI